MCQLDGKIVRQLQGLFSIQEGANIVHEVALVMLLQLQEPMKPWGEEGMMWVKQREEGKDMFMVKIRDIEGMAHLVAMVTDRV